MQKGYVLLIILSLFFVLVIVFSIMNSDSLENKGEMSMQEKAENEIDLAKRKAMSLYVLSREVKNAFSVVERSYNSQIYTERSISLNDIVHLSDDGDVVLTSEKIILTESHNSKTNNSAFFDMAVPTEENDRMMTVNYNFIDEGRGDEFGIWTNEEKVFYLVGANYIEVLDSATFDFGGEEFQTITFALHAYGDIDSKVEISNITVSSIKPEFLLDLRKAYGDIELLNEYEIETNVSNEVFEIINLTIPEGPVLHFPWGFAAEDAFKKAEEAYNISNYSEAYAYAYSSRIIIDKIVLSWKI